MKMKMLFVILNKPFIPANVMNENRFAFRVDLHTPQKDKSKSKTIVSNNNTEEIFGRNEINDCDDTENLCASL